MNGDEDLGQNIIMKGDHYHYNQGLAEKQFATGMNGDEDLGQNIIMKGDHYHYNQGLSQEQSLEDDTNEVRICTGFNDFRCIEPEEMHKKVEELIQLWG